MNVSWASDPPSPYVLPLSSKSGTLSYYTTVSLPKVRVHLAKGEQVHVSGSLLESNGCEERDRERPEYVLTGLSVREVELAEGDADNDQEGKILSVQMSLAAVAERNRGGVWRERQETCQELALKLTFASSGGAGALEQALGDSFVYEVLGGEYGEFIEEEEGVMLMLPLLVGCPLSFVLNAGDDLHVMSLTSPLPEGCKLTGVEPSPGVRVSNFFGERRRIEEAILPGDIYNLVFACGGGAINPSIKVRQGAASREG